MVAQLKLAGRSRQPPNTKCFTQLANILASGGELKTKAGLRSSKVTNPRPEKMPESIGARIGPRTHAPELLEFDSAGLWRVAIEFGNRGKIRVGLVLADGYPEKRTDGLTIGGV